MRGSAANVLRIGVMIALVALGVTVLYGKPEAPPPQPEPKPPRWNDLSAVVNAWERSPLAAPAPPEGCGVQVSIPSSCAPKEGAGTLSGAEGACAARDGRFVFELSAGATGTVTCGIGACTSRPVALKPGAPAARTVTGAFTGCSAVWPTE